MAALRKHSASHDGLTQVYEHCPRRPYVELSVPADCERVTAAVFTTVSRDQGWADEKIQSYTWFEVALRRPGGRTDVGTIRIQHNRAGNDEFFEFETKWDVEHSKPRAKAWLRLLRPGDTIQIIPKAIYRCWVNIIRYASIKIEYQAAAAVTHQPQSVPASSDTWSAPVYSPLRYIYREIRVLVVEPGEQGADIDAHFEHKSLDHGPGEQSGFHALSYCWGEQTERAAISLSTQSGKVLFAISPTVQRAIRRLRQPDSPLHIWIDAVCINQQDLEERAQQVAMMGHIYSRAEAVHVWLDEEILGLPEALRLIRDIYNCNHRVCPGADQCRCSGTAHVLSADELDAIVANKGHPTLGYMHEVFDKHRSTRYFDAAAVEAGGGEGDVHLAYFMQTFFHHPWFQRVWVVQEAILAPKTTLHSASEAISWEEVLFVNDITSSREFATLALNFRTRNSMPSIWKTLVHAHGWGKSRSEEAGDEKDDKNDDGHKPLTILDVFLAALDMKATDPRDKLFALLPFGQETCVVANIPPALQPAYTKPLASIMAGFSRWWILENRSLDVLSFIHRQPARAWRRTIRDEDPSVPATSATWALGTEGYAQWSNMTLREQFPTFRAAGGTRPDESLLHSDDDDDDLHIALRGWHVGKIQALDHPPKDLVCPYTGTDDNTDLKTVFHRMFDPSGRTGQWLLHGSNHDLGESDPEQLQYIFDEHVDAHYGYISAPEQAQYVLQVAEDTDVLRYQRYQLNELPACIERCFFVTSDGRRGLCPWTAKDGDVIAVLHGGNVPYLLRPVEGSETEGYELVGECFVEGLMTGAIAEEEEARQARIFVLH